VDDFSITGLALAAGGKILASASGGYHFGAVVRFNPDGSLDTSFGTTGAVQLVEPAMGIRSVGGGKFVVVTGVQSAQVLRYNADGSIDQAFAAGGVLTLSDVSSPGNNLLAVLGDGKLLVAGTTSSGPDDILSNQYAVYRINPDGSLDATFGKGGRAATPAGAPLRHKPFALALQGDGKILLAGMQLLSINSNFAVTRLNPDGTPDGSFGDGGVVTTLFPPQLAQDWQIPSDFATTVAVQADGRIVVAGYADVRPATPDSPYASEVDFGLARYLPDGSLDNSFGDGGKLTTSFGRNDVPAASVITADGKLIVVGTGQTPTGGSDFALGRYLLNDPNPLTAAVEGGVLKITGTAAADTIRLRVVGGRLTITGIAETFALGAFSAIQIAGMGGDDRIDASVATVPVTADGGAGDDSILGGSAGDALAGGTGNDTLFGGGASDTLRGGDGNDYLNGGPGADQLLGDAGNDQIFAVDSVIDTIDGGGGFDRVKADVDDLLAGTEAPLA
jgi:uncharacterized delta-60 repeat protein